MNLVHANCVAFVQMLEIYLECAGLRTFSDPMCVTIAELVAHLSKDLCV